MRVFIIQENQIHLKNLQQAIHQLGYTCIGSIDGSSGAVGEIKKVLPDVILIDIHLKGELSAIDMCKLIRSFYKIPILFTVADYSLAIASGAADALPGGYLSMPVDKDTLQANLLLAYKKNQELVPSTTNSLPNIFIKNGAKLIKVVLNTILFIYTDSKNYCSLITTDNKKLSVRYSIQGIYRLLDKSAFVQSHRSYIINWRKVDTIYESDQTLEIQGHHIPIGRTYKKNIYTKLNII